jgi:hypothetical protein
MTRMARTELTIEQVLPILSRSPARIAELTAELTPLQLKTRPVPEEWSANDVLAHLRACADMWGGSIATMLREDHPTIRAINPTTSILDTDYPDRPFRPSLRAYAQQREELLAMLNPLTREEWARGATFTGAGAPLERTVLAQARRLARHERPHLKQIARLAASMGV